MFKIGFDNEKYLSSIGAHQKQDKAFGGNCTSNSRQAV
jgi:hypothetical protein